MSKETKKIKNVGVVVATHTDYGTRLIAAAEMILGEQNDCVSVSVDISHGMDDIVESLRQAVESVDKGGGVMILTDMFGGTPTNLSLSLLGAYKLEVITGVNLPMLLKVLGMRSMPLAKLADEAKSAGMQGIVVAGEVLRKKVAGG
ncbi:PTS sugar transporter subunit IIA [Desulfovibrio ferrophilus]|uniref:Phosphotransferase system enzyme IIA component n=1 Tax=Desulfovibrio ferrophilus TaxID=241368 RepID=A0A2Z6AWE5_9BACT|nr:PTS sugar transporter subunit IIA [Desulfovibrio ferrophilus]BBD07577.1 phosphotransferase system enzyme IIA component [Desulfovibrio ferrophilus]